MPTIKQWFGVPFQYEANAALNATVEAEALMDRTMREGMARAKEEGKFIVTTSHVPCYEISAAMGMFAFDLIQLTHLSAAGWEVGKFNDASARPGLAGFRGGFCPKLPFTYAYWLEPDKVKHPPFGGVPLPDIIIQSQIHCDDEAALLNLIAKEWNIPIYTFDAPFNMTGAGYGGVEQGILDYFVSETKGMITFLEQQTGTKLDMDKLAEVQKREDQVARLKAELYELRKAVPAPMNSLDGHIDLFHTYLMLIGRKERVQILEKVVAEVKDRVKNKVGVVPEEKIRLLCGFVDYVNPGLLSYFEKDGAVFVMEQATPSIPWDTNFRFDPSHMLESMGRKYLISLTNNPPFRSSHPGQSNRADMVKDFKIDGIVRSGGGGGSGCRMLNIGGEFRARTQVQGGGVPSMAAPFDIVDERYWNDAVVKERIGDFIKSLPSR